MSIITGSYFGFIAFPVIISSFAMIAYFSMSLYLNTQNIRQISIEQLADSNYYLGFMFTLLSILTSLSNIATNLSNIENIINYFSIALTTTVLGLLARIYLINFIPTDETNKEIMNQSISEKINMINGTLLENMRKNELFSQMIDEKMHIVIDKTESSMFQFNKLLDKNFKDSIDTFEDLTHSITSNMKRVSNIQSRLLTREFAKYKKAVGSHSNLILSLGKEVAKSKNDIREASDAMINLAENQKNILTEKHNMLDGKNTEYISSLSKHTKLIKNFTDTIEEYNKKLN